MQQLKSQITHPELDYWEKAGLPVCAVSKPSEYFAKSVGTRPPLLIYYAYHLDIEGTAQLAIEWDVIAVEMTLLAAIIYGAVYLELWAYKRAESKKDKQTTRNIIRYILNDLRSKIAFIDESIRLKDYKPFFTHMWDAVIHTNKQGLLSFEIFESIQETYSWMRYYNTELESMKLGQQKEVRQSIEGTLKQLKATTASTWYSRPF